MTDIASSNEATCSDADPLGDVIRTDEQGRGWARIIRGDRLLAALDVGELLYLAALHRGAAMRVGVTPERQSYHLAQADTFWTGARSLDPGAAALGASYVVGVA